jgi:hypothetical protein
MDDGGLPLKESIDWIQCGIDRASFSQIDGMVREWGREEWSAEIGRQTTNVYYIQNEYFFEIINTAVFVKLLSHWKLFLLKYAERPDFLEVKVSI